MAAPSILAPASQAARTRAVVAFTLLGVAIAFVPASMAGAARDPCGVTGEYDPEAFLRWWLLAVACAALASAVVWTRRLRSPPAPGAPDGLRVLALAALLDLLAMIVVGAGVRFDEPWGSELVVFTVGAAVVGLPALAATAALGAGLAWAEARPTRP